MTDEATPTPEAVGDFNAGVQNHIDTQAALGVELTWEEAVTQFGNFLKNYAADPDGVARLLAIAERVDDLETARDNHEARIAHLEEVGGGVVVGPDNG